MAYFDENQPQDEDRESREPDDPIGSVEYTPVEDYRPRTGGFYATMEEEKRNRKGHIRRTLVACVTAIALMGAALFGGIVIGRSTLGGTPGTQSPGKWENLYAGTSSVNRGDLALNVVESTADPSAKGTIPAVVEQVKDTVVEIRTETTVNSVYYGNYVESGAGSGVILSSDGLIVTCNHVIDGAETIRVVLTDGSVYEAEVYGSDSWSDLALLHIDANNLPYASLANSASGTDAYSYMAVGETVIAIGNPLGELGGSVTSGIISALGRSVTVEGIPMKLMQIDASVNPGNSGGGLFNMEGHLIGIVSAKSTGEEIEGIGFAIPSSDVIPIVQSLYKQGYVSGRPFLGLYFSDGLQISSYEYNDELSGGNEIVSGDVLYSADGIRLESVSGLKTILAGKKIGDTVEIQVVRYVRGNYGYVQQVLDFTLLVHEYAPSLPMTDENGAS